MDSSLTKTIGLAAITALIATFVARANGSPVNEAAGTLAADSAAMAHDSVVTPKWLSDANVLSLLGVMNARQTAAADIELSSWHSDTVRAFAASMAREHAELQRSADSAAGRMHLAPVSPAIADQVNGAFQAQIDSLLGNRGSSLDRAYVRQQVASHKLMADYVDQLSGVATRSDLQALLGMVGARVAAQLSRAQALQASFAAADSIAADSLARRAARATRRNRQGENR